MQSTDHVLFQYNPLHNTIYFYHKKNLHIQTVWLCISKQNQRLEKHKKLKIH